MTDLVPQPDRDLLPKDWRSKTPARIFTGSDRSAYETNAWLSLRQDHASAVDAVWRELDLQTDFPPEFVQSRGLFEVQTQAADKREYLLRPDLGRRLSETATATLASRCTPGCDFQIVIGDGLSSAAVAAQVPAILPLLESRAVSLGWSIGQTFVVRHCRVGVLNEIGDLLKPKLVVLLIGERPGLATAESLSAYMAYKPQPGHTDAQRNLISNIHGAGLKPAGAAERILNLAAKMMSSQLSGCLLKEGTAPTASLTSPANATDTTV